MERARQLVRTLFLAILVVMLIACANLAGLLLVRAIRRRREVAVRRALGAPAGRLLCEAVLESMALSVSGGVLGLLLAENLLRVGVSWPPETLPRIHEIGLDVNVALFAIVIAVATGSVCGLVPAFAALRTSVNETLKEAGRTGTAGGGHARLRSALVVGEIAIALVLLVASGLLLRSFEKMRAVDLGFRPDHALTAYYSLPPQQYPTQSAVDRFNDELIRRVQQLPGVTSVGLTHARGGNPHCARLTAVRNSAAGFYVRSQTCGRRLCGWIVGRRGSLPPAALIPVWRQSVRPARSSAGRGLRTNVGLIGFLDCR